MQKCKHYTPERLFQEFLPQGTWKPLLDLKNKNKKTDFSWHICVSNWAPVTNNMLSIQKRCWVYCILTLCRAVDWEHNECNFIIYSSTPYPSTWDNLSFYPLLPSKTFLLSFLSIVCGSYGSIIWIWFSSFSWVSMKVSFNINCLVSPPGFWASDEQEPCRPHLGMCVPLCT